MSKSEPPVVKKGRPAVRVADAGTAVLWAPQETFPTYLAALRAGAALPLREASSHLGVSFSYLRALETEGSSRAPELELLARIAVVYDQPLQDVLDAAGVKLRVPADGHRPCALFLVRDLDETRDCVCAEYTCTFRASQGTTDTGGIFGTFTRGRERSKRRRLVCAVCGSVCSTPVPTGVRIGGVVVCAQCEPQTLQTGESDVTP